MIKVLEVSASLFYGGTEKFIFNNLKELEKENMFSFSILVLGNYEEKLKMQLEDSGIKVFLKDKIQFENSLHLLKELTNFFKEEKFDIVHTHINYANSYISKAAKNAKIPLVISHAHSIVKSNNNFLKKIYKNIQRNIIVKNSDVLLATSYETGIINYGESTFRKKGKVIRNGVVLSDFSKINNSKKGEALKKEYNLSDEIIITNISRFDNNKNIEKTILVFKEFLKIYPNSVLVLGGKDGGTLDVCIKLVHDLNIENKVKFVGETEYVPQWLAVTDVFLFTSKTEGFSYSVLEAQLANCKVLASSCIPKDSNLDLGLVDYEDLEATNAEWAKDLTELYERKCNVLDKDIYNAITYRKLSISETSKELEELYLSVL